MFSAGAWNAPDCQLLFGGSGPERRSIRTPLLRDEIFQPWIYLQSARSAAENVHPRRSRGRVH
jgi:hypothetical protein